MKAKEIIKKISNDFPKLWEKLKAKYHMWSIYKDYIDLVFSLEKAEFNFYNVRGEGYLIPVEFSMLYGLLEDFFDEIDIDLLSAWFRLEYGILLKANKPNMQIKNKAREKAILKSCEILEKSLTNKSE